MKTHDLVEGGGDIHVANDNRERYVELYVKYVLEDSIHEQFDAFYDGFYQVCGGPTLGLFRHEELELLICGLPHFDFDALERVTIYHNGYSKDSQIIKWFWEVVKSMSLDEKKHLLFFTTGNDRAPVGGLATLKFIITRNGDDTDMICAVRALARITRQQHWIESLVNAPTLEMQKELWFSTVGKWLMQANIITRVSAFFMTNPVVLWFCAGVCKGQLNLIRKEDNIYKLHKEEMSASKKVAVVEMCMFGIVCLVGIASINILELTHEFRVSRSLEFAIFSRIFYLYKYLLQRSC